MSRVPRKHLVASGTVNHCTWRGHGHAHVLDSDAARGQFLELLRKYKDRFGVEVHAYCLMGTHPHVLCRSTRGQLAFSAFWRSVNWAFACWYNRRTDGRGQVVMDRMRSPLVQEGRYQLAVMRYGDANPVRAGLVRGPGEWRWSSYRHYAYGQPDDLITDAPEYLALGSMPVHRRLAYRHLFATPPPGASARAGDLVRVPFVGEDRWCAAQRAMASRPGPS